MAIDNIPEGVSIVQLNPENYIETRNTLLARLSSSRKGLYIAMSTPYPKLSTELAAEGIKMKNLYFIDCISKKGGISKVTDSCYYVGRRDSLTELSIAITEYLGSGEYSFCIFDSITDLAKFIDLNLAVKFLHYLVGKVLILEIDGILFSYDDSLSKKIVSLITPHLDRYRISTEGEDIIDLNIINAS